MGNTAGSLGFSIGDVVFVSKGRYELREGKSKEGRSVSVFRSLTSVKSFDENASHRLRTLRHPYVVECVGMGSTKDGNFIATEEVFPLSTYLERMRREGSQSWLRYGIYCVCSALSFLHNDCQLHHNTISVDTIFVTKSGDWKIGCFETLKPMNNRSQYTGLSVDLDVLPLVPTRYQAPEFKAKFLTNDDKELRSLDTWAVGCLLQELFSPSFAQDASLTDVTHIPSELRPIFKRLLSRATPRGPDRRIEELRDHPEIKSDRLTEILLFLQEMAMKTPEEKKAFFTSLVRDVAEVVPVEICKYKVVPELLKALEFGAALGGGTVVLASVLECSKHFEQEEYQEQVVPAVVRLFQSTDRSVRFQLLEHMPSYITKLDKRTVDKDVFPLVVTGFGDTSTTMREATVKSAVHLAPVISYSNLHDRLIKLLQKRVELDKAVRVRMNATICFGMIAHAVDPKRLKDAVLAPLVRALNDSAHCRVAALKSFRHILSLLPPELVAKKLLSLVGPLTVDKSVEVRKTALGLISRIVAILEESSEQREKQEAEEKARAEAEGGRERSGSNAKSTASAVLKSGFGWAMSSLKGKFGAGSGAVTPGTTPSSIASSQSGVDTPSPREGGVKKERKEEASSRDSERELPFEGNDESRRSSRGGGSRSESAGGSRDGAVAMRLREVKDTGVAEMDDGWDFDDDLDDMPGGGLEARQAEGLGAEGGKGAAAAFKSAEGGGGWSAGLENDGWGDMDWDVDEGFGEMGQSSTSHAQGGNENGRPDSTGSGPAQQSQAGSRIGSGGGSEGGAVSLSSSPWNEVEGSGRSSAAAPTVNVKSGGESEKPPVVVRKLESDVFDGWGFDDDDDDMLA